jgi:hypothetical protein
MINHRVNYLIPTNTSQCRHSVAQLTTEKAKFLNGDVAYYWTRSVPDSQLYRYARYLYFGKHSTHPAFYNVERSEGKSIRCIKN